MTFHEAFFWICAITAVGSAAMVFLTPGIVHMAFWLLASLAGFAGLYLHLNADFVGFVQVLVYIGGILILFLFGVMLTARVDIAARREASWRSVLPGVLVGLGAISFLVLLVRTTPWIDHGIQSAEPTSEGIGTYFMSTYVLPFEAVSVLLLVAMIGATYVARGRADEDVERGGAS